MSKKPSKKKIPADVRRIMAQGEDQETAEMLAAYERGELVLAPNQEELRNLAMAAARNYLRKDARINIRLSSADVDMLKRRAAVEGIPYQTLIASVLHKYVSGTLS
jgi:predicted DNA binding CopG/RHH family protein